MFIRGSYMWTHNYCNILYLLRLFIWVCYRILFCYTTGYMKEKYICNIIPFYSLAWQIWYLIYHIKVWKHTCKSMLRFLYFWEQCVASSCLLLTDKFVSIVSTWAAHWWWGLWGIPQTKGETVQYSIVLLFISIILHIMFLCELDILICMNLYLQKILSLSLHRKGQRREMLIWRCYTTPCSPSTCFLQLPFHYL